MTSYSQAQEEFHEAHEELHGRAVPIPGLGGTKINTATSTNDLDEVLGASASQVKLRSTLTCGAGTRICHVIWEQSGLVPECGAEVEVITLDAGTQIQQGSRTRDLHVLQEANEPARVCLPSLLHCFELEGISKSQITKERL